jgi:hypothetical protein
MFGQHFGFSAKPPCLDDAADQGLFSGVATIVGAVMFRPRLLPIYRQYSDSLGIVTKVV